MKSTALIIFIFLTSVGYAQTNNRNTGVEVYGTFKQYAELDTAHTIETGRYIFDLNRDGHMDTLILENLKDLVADPQLYSIIRISMYPNRNILLKNVSGCFADTSVISQIKSRLKSDKVLVLDLPDGNSVFMVWDYKYPDCTAGFEIFELSARGFKSTWSQNIVISKLRATENNRTIYVEGEDPCTGKSIKKEITFTDNK